MMFTQDCHIDTQSKKKQRAFNCTVKELPSYYDRKRSEPALLASSSSDMSTSTQEGQTSSDTDLIWVFTRQINSDDQIIPGLSGWVSATGHLPKCLTIIGYYRMINAPQECMRCSQEGSADAGQEYTINTFALGVFMKVYPMIWSESKKYIPHHSNWDIPLLWIVRERCWQNILYR